MEQKNNWNVIQINEPEQTLSDNSDNNENDNKSKEVDIKNKVSKYYKNPSIEHYTIDSFFYYDLTKMKEILSPTWNKNSLKLSDLQITFLESYINEHIKLWNKNKELDLIQIWPFFENSLNNLEIIQPKNNNISLFIEEIIKNNIGKHISCRKLSKLFEEKNGIKISKSKIHYILKNQLKYKYLKTSVKKYTLQERNSKIMSLSFIKIFTRGLKLGYYFIFVDESALENINNNFRCWRKQDDTIYYKLVDKQRRNLWLAVGIDKLIYYEITKDTTKGSHFLLFLKNVIKKIEELKIKKFIIIQDNASIHKSWELRNYYFENKINVLFIPPYLSYFNSIELSFRFLKNFLYKELFSSITDVEKRVEELINSSEFNNNVLANFLETIQQYISYSIKNKYINFNIN